MQGYTPRPLIDCPACSSPMQLLGKMPVRKDAAEAHVIVLAAPGDNAPAAGLDVYRCGACGKLEFYDHDFQMSAV